MVRFCQVTITNTNTNIDIYKYEKNAKVIGGKGTITNTNTNKNTDMKAKANVNGGEGEIVLLCQVLRFRRTRGEPRHFYKGDHPQNAEVENFSNFSNVFFQTVQIYL